MLLNLLGFTILLVFAIRTGQVESDAIDYFRVHYTPCTCNTDWPSVADIPSHTRDNRNNPLRDCIRSTHHRTAYGVVRAEVGMDSSISSSAFSFPTEPRPCSAPRFAVLPLLAELCPSRQIRKYSVPHRCKRS